MADILGFIRKAFPFIAAGASLGGPVGTMAAGLVGKALGVDAPKPTPEGISAAIVGATPEQLVELQKAEQEFKLQMEALGFNHIEELEQIAFADRQNARDREMKTGDRTPKILAYTTCILCVAAEAMYFFHGAHVGTSPELIGRILGTLDSALMLVLGYYFGSSVGSDAKTQTLSEIAKNK